VHKQLACFIFSGSDAVQSPAIDREEIEGFPVPAHTNRAAGVAGSASWQGYAIPKHREKSAHRELHRFEGFTIYGSVKEKETTLGHNTGIPLLKE
jgi:flavorubredoxin